MTSDKKKEKARPFTLIHPIKTGGKAVQKGLRSIMIPLGHLAPPASEGKVWWRHHEEVMGWQGYAERYPVRWHNYAKVGIIRDPWQRLLSWHRYALWKQDPDIVKALLAAKISEDYYADYVFRPLFDLHCTSSRMIGLDVILPPRLDYTLRTSHLAEDFEGLVKFLGLTDVDPIQRFNVTPNTSGRVYTDYYTPRTALAVARQYLPEIKRYNFTYPLSFSLIIPEIDRITDLTPHDKRVLKTQLSTHFTAQPEPIS